MAWGRVIGGMVGGALAGPPGTLAGHLIGGVAGHLIDEQAKSRLGEAAAGVVVVALENTVGEETGDRLREAGRRIVAHSRPEERAAIQTALQAAVRDAMLAAIEDVRTAQDRPWRGGTTTATRVEELLRGLAVAVRDGRVPAAPDGATGTTEAVARALASESHDTHGMVLYDTMGVRVRLEGLDGDTLRQVREACPTFDTYLRRALDERLEVRFGEQVQRQPGALDAVNKLILEGVRETLADLKIGQEETKQALDHLLAQATTGEALRTLSTEVTGRLQGLSTQLIQLQRNQGEGFGAVLERLDRQETRHVEQATLLREVHGSTGRIENMIRDWRGETGGEAARTKSDLAAVESSGSEKKPASASAGRPEPALEAVRKRLSAADRLRLDGLVKDYEAVSAALSNTVDPLTQTRLERQREDVQRQIADLARVVDDGR